MQELVDQVISTCKRNRPFSTDEKLLQAALEKVLPIGFVREHHLNKSCIIDFFYKGCKLGIECKVKGSESKILAQLLDYALTLELDWIILLTTKPISNHPQSFHVNGKEVPLTVLQLICV